MTKRATVRLITELVCAWNEHNLDAVLAFYAPDYEGIDFAMSQSWYGLSALHAALQSCLESFPDLQISVEEIIVERNQIVLLWVAEATQDGVFMRIPPTHRRVRLRGVSRLVLRNGLVRFSWHIWDLAGLLREIGLLPDL